MAERRVAVFEQPLIGTAVMVVPNELYSKATFRSVIALPLMQIRLRSLPEREKVCPNSTFSQMVVFDNPVTTVLGLELLTLKEMGALKTLSAASVIESVSEVS